MNDWRQVKLGDVADGVTVGHVGSMAQEYRTDGIPLLRSQNVLPHGFDLKDVKYIDSDFHARLKKSALRAGDVVTVRTGKPGATAVVPPHWAEANCSDLVITRPGNEIDPHWLSYYINSAAAGYIDSQLVGAVQQHFNVGAAKNMTLNLPPLPEQQAIAEVLGSLDDKVAANTKLVSTADELLSTRFTAVLTHGHVHVPLKSIADVNALTVKPSPAGQLRYIDIASVGVGSYEFPAVTPWDEAPSRARRRVRKGDTIWSTVRPNRRSHALNLSRDPLLVGSTGLAVLSARDVGWAYLYEVTRRPEFTAYLETVAEGSAYPAVRAHKFGEALVPLVPEIDQRSFERFAQPLREALHSLDKENRHLAATRDALLPQLMSGKLRVKDAELLVETAL